MTKLREIKELGLLSVYWPPGQGGDIIINAGDFVEMAFPELFDILKGRRKTEALLFFKGGQVQSLRRGQRERLGLFCLGSGRFQGLLLRTRLRRALRRAVGLDPQARGRLEELVQNGGPALLYRLGIALCRGADLLVFLKPDLNWKEEQKETLFSLLHMTMLRGGAVLWLVP